MMPYIYASHPSASFADFFETNAVSYPKKIDGDEKDLKCNKATPFACDDLYLLVPQNAMCVGRKRSPKRYM